MLQYLLSFISGALVKSVDWIEDDLRGPSPLRSMRWELAIIAGAIIGYLIATADFANIFLAALFAQIFARKVDKDTHMVTFFMAIAIPFVMGTPYFEPIVFAMFVIPAFMDELEFPGKYSVITEYRLFLNAAGIIYGLMFGFWGYFFGIFCFDVGYIGTKLYHER